MKYLLSAVLCFFPFFTLFAQSKPLDSTKVGQLKGVVKDSVYNYVLQAASVAIYVAKDSVLLGYQLSDQVGEFNFKRLPVGVPLKLVASYIGYSAVTSNFTIDREIKELDLKYINMERVVKELEEVVVRYLPPVQMKGDTLVFNADAFELEPNATVEDLMRKLPAVTVWGDGMITVNGKEVKNFTVNGKPFFGGDPKIAIQNIPKNAVDQIQVYSTKQSKENPLDSISSFNIKLKKNKNFGHFGKLGGGYGTSDHYEADGNLNFFSNRTQFGVVAATNDVNKVAYNVETLMRNSTYKGTGASVEYQPDFRTKGINKPSAGGFTFQHDFIEKSSLEEINRLKSNYFLRDKRTFYRDNLQTITAIDGISNQIQQNQNDDFSNSTSHDFNASYDNRKKNKTYNTSIDFKRSRDVSDHKQFSRILNEDNEVQSTNSSLYTNENIGKEISFSAGIDRKKDYSTQYNERPGDFLLKYDLYAGDYNNNGSTQTDFVSLSDLSQNKAVNRKNNHSDNNLNQQLQFGLGDFSPWIFKKGPLRKISLELNNYLYYKIHHEDNLVNNIDATTGQEFRNDYLTVDSKYYLLNDLYALNFSRSFVKSLSDRYNKSLVFKVNVQGQYYDQRNSSDQAFQNISQNYNRFVPDAEVSFRNYQYGDFDERTSLQFKKSVDYPTFEQLVPLVDSANLYNVRLGNIMLKPTDRRELDFSFNHSKLGSRNDLSYFLHATAGVLDNSFADSSNTDGLGRRTFYTVNMDRNKYLSVGGYVNRSFKVGLQHQVQLRFNFRLSLAKVPSYLNGLKNESANFYRFHSLDAYYTFTDAFAMIMSYSNSYNRSRQIGANSREFNYHNNKVTLSGSWKLIRQVILGSDVAYDYTSSFGSGSINYTIWNAYAKYRLLKADNLEFKLSALDLLHQNTGLSNYVNNNSISTSTANVLRQYFMFSCSYFPRAFGKKEK
ncbi:hypothetical protein ACVWYN_000417 [Pedobacter sp. UYP24]